MEDPRTTCRLAGVRKDLIDEVHHDGHYSHEQWIDAMLQRESSGRGLETTVETLTELGLTEESARTLMDRLNPEWKDHYNASSWAREFVRGEFERKEELGGYEPAKCKGTLYSSEPWHPHVRWYHGTSLQTATTIMVHRPNPSYGHCTNDFGCGFYLSEEEDEAKSWAACKAVSPAVMTFALPDDFRRVWNGVRIEGERWEGVVENKKDGSWPRDVRKFLRENDYVEGRRSGGGTHHQLCVLSPEMAESLRLVKVEAL